MACECRRASWYSLETWGGGPKGRGVKKGLKAVDKAGLPEVLRGSEGSSRSIGSLNSSGGLNPEVATNAGGAGITNWQLWRHDREESGKALRAPEFVLCISWPDRSRQERPGRFGERVNVGHWAQRA